MKRYITKWHIAYKCRECQRIYNHESSVCPDCGDTKSFSFGWNAVNVRFFIDPKLREPKTWFKWHVEFNERN